MPQAEPIVSVRNLHRTYGRGASACHAIRGIDFTIDRGEWVSIVGPSGSGKTTLLNILGALDTNYKGSIAIGGYELSRLSDRRLCEVRGQSIGFVFQQFNLLPHLTVLDNVMIPGMFAPRRKRQKDFVGRAQGLLEKVGLTDKLTVRPSELSGGQQQRVAVARALFNNAEILLCDEPTGALDHATGTQVMELFSQLNTEDGITLIIVTHEPHISNRGRRIIEMVDGRINRDRSVAEATRLSAAVPLPSALDLAVFDLAAIELVPTPGAQDGAGMESAASQALGERARDADAKAEDTADTEGQDV